MRTSKPMIAGVLMIIGGMLSITISTFSLFNIIITQDVWWEYNILILIIMFIHFAFILIGIFAIIGGTFSIMRKHYGWAKAGSIFTFLGWGFIFGIPALVLIVLAEDEFE